jgi:histidinol-phosphate phosphatase family protein
LQFRRTVLTNPELVRGTLELMPKEKTPVASLGSAATAAFTVLRDARRGFRRARLLSARPEAILFDREGALVPASGASDPREVELVPGAADAVALARAAGMAVGVVRSESALHGLTSEETTMVNARVHELVGPVDVWLECTHDPDEDCPCRKPAPGLIYLAAAALGTRPERCVVVSDAGADVEAARAAGARAVLVPSSRTSPEEIDAAPVVAANLEEAVTLALGKAA